MNLSNLITSMALRLLTRRMMTEHQVREKLLERFSDALEEVGAVIDRLKKEKLLDDEAYVRAYLEYELSTSFRGKYGYWKKLMQKGIEKSFFEKVWRELEPDESVLAQKLLENNAFRFDSEKDPLKKKLKIQRFLAGRGFPFTQ